MPKVENKSLGSLQARRTPARAEHYKKGGGQGKHLSQCKRILTIENDNASDLGNSQQMPNV